MAFRARWLPTVDSNCGGKEWQYKILKLKSWGQTWYPDEKGIWCDRWESEEYHDIGRMPDIDLANSYSSLKDYVGRQDADGMHDTTIIITTGRRKIVGQKHAESGEHDNLSSIDSGKLGRSKRTKSSVRY